MSFVSVQFQSYSESVAEALNLIGAGSEIIKHKKFLIKPNLVNASPHPITTPAACCAAVIDYIRSVSTDAEIIIGEGCGDIDMTTWEVFDILGYRKLADTYNVKLADLNTEPLIKKENNLCPYFPEIYLPEILFECYLISVPVLKAHSLSKITGSLKNMVGAAPPEHYQGQYGIWKKAFFHNDIHQAVLDLNSYRTPDLSIMDASIGMAEYHLGGAECNPPVGKILAGFDPVIVDREAAKLLGFDWTKIPHLSQDSI